VAEQPSVLVLNGPNLNMLGRREPGLYGRATLADIERACVERGQALGLAVDCRQSNQEGDLVDAIQQAGGSSAALVINAGAYSHTSVAILDALLTLDIPIVEVHLTNIFAREPFRHHSHVSAAATGVICGLGANGYLLALDAIAERLNSGT
jgi:3-dehydroquinate dehydratase II